MQSGFVHSVSHTARLAPFALAGFVSYDNATTAAQAIHCMNGYVWAGQRLRVSLKTARTAANPY